MYFQICIFKSKFNFLFSILKTRFFTCKDVPSLLLSLFTSGLFLEDSKWVGENLITLTNGIFYYFSSFEIFLLDLKCTVYINRFYAHPSNFGPAKTVGGRNDNHGTDLNLGVELSVKRWPIKFLTSYVGKNGLNSSNFVDFWS